jgi:hypothetical protein
VNEVVEVEDEAAAVAWLHARGRTDGLPVVVPTAERIDAMLATVDLDRDLSLGDLGPSGAAATLEFVAASAVMAGCEPVHFPVVVAAVEAVADPAFALGPVQTTTHGLGPMIVVNGPARDRCGSIASGAGALGPGHAANAVIGRALRLALINIGGGRPGTTDMAQLGHPGKFTYCLAEAEERSPWGPLADSLGARPGESSVTVVAAEAPHSVITVLEHDDPRTADRILDTLAATAGGLGSNNAYLGKGCVVVLLSPDHATYLDQRGLSRRDVQRELYERAGHTPEILAAHGGPSLVTRAPVAGRETLPIVPTADDILVVVAGSSGPYCAVAPTWGGGDRGNVPVRRRIRIDEVCEVPFGVT